jgi:hypothetical protein
MEVQPIQSMSIPGNQSPKSILNISEIEKDTDRGGRARLRVARGLRL